MKTKKLTLIAVLLGLALIIFVLEAQLPPIVPVPGIKLGLANIITLTALYLLGKREAFIILILRVVLSSVFTGNFVGFLYSIAGGLVSFAFMSTVSLFIRENRMWVTSVFGATGHNLGQIGAAVFIMKTAQLLWYLPVLMISAVITGVFTGAAAQLTIKRLRKTDISGENKNA